METVLLTTFEKLDDAIKHADSASHIQVAVKFGEFYLAAGSGFAHLLSTLDSNSDRVTTISRRLRQSKFYSLIAISNGLSRDFELRRIYLADVHVCPVLRNTIGDELKDVSSENSMRFHLTKWNPEFFDTFILFSERPESSREQNELALRTLLRSSIAPVNRSMIGESVAVISTPFKNLAFFNTYSRGVISNVFGVNDCVFLVDVKLSVGCEGSPVYSLQNRILGMVMNVFTWVKGEWIGFSMAVNLYTVVNSWLHSSYPKFIEREPNFTEDHKIDSYAVVVVSGPRKWGTGIVLNKREGVIITCSHVVDFTTRTPVTVTYRGKHLNGEVTYATAEGTPFDLAVIRVHPTADLKEMVEFEKPTKIIEKGEAVYVIGYPLFSSKTHSVKGPSLTLGYVANVYPAAMVLTTCVTNSGASGGALIRPNGELLGIVANNVVVGDENFLVPHITIAIPFSVFWTPVENFCSSRRVADLDTLTSSDRQVRDVWELTFAGRFLKSKL